MPRNSSSHPLAHFLRRIFGIGDGENFVGTGMALADQAGDAPGKDSGLPRTCAGDDQHGPVDVFDGFPLALVRLERPGLQRLGDEKWILRLPLLQEHIREA